MDKKTIIFDLDGTIALIDKRLDLSKKNRNKKINWEVFFNPENISLDIPNPPVVKLLQLFYGDGYKIIILSGRSDRTIHSTKKWLKLHNILYHKLIMRPHEKLNHIFLNNKQEKIDLRYVPDEVLKRIMFDRFIKFKEVFLVVDDRSKVVQMWRKLGLSTFQVNDGNF